jgi:transposase
VPALPSSILEALWVHIAALLPTRPDTQPLGCHRPRIADRIVFDKLIQVLVFGCGYRRIADATCSATTLPPPGRVDPRRCRRAAAPAGAGRLRSAARLGAGAPGGGRVHHQGALRRPGCRPKSGGPPQARLEALGRHQGGWDPAGGGAGPGQPPRRRAAGRNPGRHRRGRAAARAASGAPRRQLRLSALPAGAGWPAGA